MNTSIEHIFRALGLENSYILQHNETNVSERSRIMARYAYVTINESVKLLFPAYRKVIIVIYLIYKNITRLKFITSFITNKNANIQTQNLL